MGWLETRRGEHVTGLAPNRWLGEGGLLSLDPCQGTEEVLPAAQCPWASQP